MIKNNSISLVFSRTGLIATAVLLSSCSVVGIRSEETPSYEIVRVEDNIEIRKYQPHIIATTIQKGPYKKAQRKAFKKLAGYIFGKNQTNQSIAMTMRITSTM